MLTAIILVAGLGVGRQVIQWWGDDGGTAPPGARGSSITDAFADPSQSHGLQFGDKAWAFTQQTMEGPKQRAVEALRASCREAASRAAAIESPPGPAEAEFLRSIATRKPVEEQEGAYQLFELADAFPMIAGVRPRVAAPGCRVVTWGLAFPKGQDRWTLFAFHAASSSDGGFSGLPEVRLPSDARRGLSMRVAGGGAVVSFTGPGPIETWKGFFESWFQNNGWNAAGSWMQRGTVWHGRWQQPSAAADLQIGPGGRDGLTGLLLVWPLQSPATESERS